MSGGGFGVTIGKQKTTDDLNSKTQYLTASTIGSIEKDINITAGNKADINASDIIAGGNINITGSEIAIKAGQENHTYNYKHEESRQGLSISLGGGVAGTIQENIIQPLERSRQVSNDKLKALYDIKAASKVKETVQNIKDEASKGNKADWGHINVGITNSKSTYKKHGENTTAHSSNITANKDINITATKKDINIKGSNITGENINLTAKGNVNIEATENSNKFNSKETKRGQSAGASFSIYGTSAYANAYGMKEKGEGTTITYTGSKVIANNKFNITTGKDTNIIGSKASGEKVTANIGGNLNIESLQETEKQNYKTNGKSASGSIGLSDGFNINASTNKMDSDYKSVTEQAGIYAGNKGFEINVTGNTDLKGAVIDSTATADKNTLNTGTITFSDIENKAEYDTKGYGVSYSELANREKKQSGRPVMQGDKGLIPAIPMASGDETESSTKSAVADGTITIRNKEQQKQNIENLRRETKDTLNKLDKIFDKDKIEEKQELAGQFSELSFNAIHNLSKNWTEEQKVMAHALVGYVSGELANSKSSFSTALTAGINKFVTEEILKDPAKEAYYAKHPEQLQWLSVAIGSAVGQMANGDATSGASISASATKNNRLNETEWEAFQKAIDEADTPAEINAVVNYWRGKDLENEKKLVAALEDKEFTKRLKQALKNDPYLKEFEGITIFGKTLINCTFDNSGTLGVYRMKNAAGSYELWNEAEVGKQWMLTGLESADKAIQNNLISKPGQMKKDYEYIGGNLSKNFGIVDVGIDMKGIVDKYSNVYAYGGGSIGKSILPISVSGGEGKVNVPQGKNMAQAISGASMGFNLGDIYEYSHTFGVDKYGFNEANTSEVGMQSNVGVSATAGYTKYIGSLIDYYLVKAIKEKNNK